MKKQFENIDDLFLSKINNLDDSDVEINEHLIWKDIESQLDNKKSIRILWWKYPVAACVFLLLGLGYFQYNKKTNSSINLVTKVPIYKKENSDSNDIFSKKKSTKKGSQITDIQLVENKKIDINISKNKKIKYVSNPQNITTNSKISLVLEPLNSINFQKAEIVFTPTEIKPIEGNLPKKLRVMHIEDFQVQQIDRISQPKTFYVFFNKEFNIDSQLPSVSITHPNNIN
jgi:hypothetical protein